MAQNINLYTPRPKRAADHFSRPGLLLIVVSVAVAGVLLHLVETSRQTQMRVELERAQADADRLQRLLASVPSPSADLSARLDAQEAEVAELELAAAKLSSGLLGRTGGFSAQLQALGRTTHEGVWLTAIRLDNAAGSLTLEGRALDAARVPGFIAGLKRDPLLATNAFAALELKALSESGTPEAEQLLPVHAVLFRLQGAATAEPSSASQRSAGRAPVLARTETTEASR